jgi:hypothetical protein
MSKTIQAIVAFGFSPNGFAVERYAANQVVEVSDECAADAIANEWAKEVTADDVAKAQAAHDKLVQAAEKAEAAAEKVEAAAVAARAAAVAARERATELGVGLDAEAAAAELEG